jgi:acetyltransferase
VSDKRQLGGVTLHDGTRVTFRPVTPDDEEMIADAIGTASRNTLLHRFFIPLRTLPREELRRLLNIDPATGYCLVGEVGQGTHRKLVCGARYVRLTETGKAEIALTVHDTVQGRGLGTAMLKKLIEVARHDGIRTFVAHVLATNEPMLRLLRRIAPHRRSHFHAGEVEIEFDIGLVDS